MIKVSVYKERNNIQRIEVEGHADSVPAGEYDLVCCAASITLQNAAYALSECYGIKIEMSLVPGASYIARIPSKDMSKKFIEQIILIACEHSFKQLAKDYSEYIECNTLDY